MCITLKMQFTKNIYNNHMKKHSMLETSEYYAEKSYPLHSVPSYTSFITIVVCKYSIN